MQVLYHNTKRTFVSIFRNSTLISSLGGISSPKYVFPPRFFYVLILFNLYETWCYLGEYPGTVFSILWYLPPFPTWGGRGDFPPKHPPSWNFVQLRWNLVCMSYTTIPMERFCQFSEIRLYSQNSLPCVQLKYLEGAKFFALSLDFNVWSKPDGWTYFKH